jgi:SAM-dependent methyltransferase
MSNTPFPEFPHEAYGKQDLGDDLAFYTPPRLVTHIDEQATTALERFYRTMLPEGGRLLDLMSSWVSHLPRDRHYAEVVGHGMNKTELAANSRLRRWFVQKLNQDFRLLLGDHAFDAALCCVGIQYLQQPLEVFAEVRRVLVPGAPFIVSFSNRCFPTKAVAIWQALDTNGHATLVKLYLERAGFADISTNLLTDGTAGDPLVVVVGRVPQQ